MNRQDSRYTTFALCREMLDTVEVIRRFDTARTADVANAIADAGRLMLTGEGSSRIFPARNMIRKALTRGAKLQVVTDGSRQAATYDLTEFAVFAASNSGRTKEVVTLIQRLRAAGNDRCYGLTANEGTLLAEHAAATFVLSCGWEQAVAATKSVAEQALFYQSILDHCTEAPAEPFGRAADAVATALSMPIDRQVVDLAARAGTIYFAGYNDGVAEELTLKTNEITRRKSDFLEGTYAVHGIEEVMDADDVVFVVEPIEEELPKFKEVLVDGVGLTVVAIATHPTDLPTIQVPEAGELTPFVYLAAGWNLLVETGLGLGIDLDKPTRARKVGNEFVTPQ